MEYVVRATGEFGEEAKQILVTFINEKQDDHWRYVTLEEYEGRQLPEIRSVIVKPKQPPRIHMPLKRSCLQCHLESRT